VVLSDLQGKSLVRQRSISGDSLLFVVVCFFIGTHYLAPLGLVTFVATYGEAILSTYKETNNNEKRD
jgi:hypothetical protein